ncbi:MAG: response regulator transcription factor [Clostridia bacterium]|nr:response regulator transcription factor [Clostridia bacterium]MBR2417833.1 response regulator transcription factor [Clostridia bacterium]
MAILVVDDDIRINELLCDIFSTEGYEVLSAFDGERALKKLEKNKNIDLIVLDIMMPELDGWEVLKYVKNNTDCKVLMLTALTDEKSEVTAIRSGADDYVAKPFKRAVLLERAKRLIQERTREKSRKYESDGLVLSVMEHKVYIDGNEVKMTAKEFNLLHLLMKNSSIVLSREAILDKIWGYVYDGNDRTIDTHIKMLRHSIGDYSDRIRTVRGVGYSFEGEVKVI